MSVGVSILQFCNPAILQFKFSDHLLHGGTMWFIRA